MNVIIEGPDASGKTTLAKKIAAKYKMAYLHLDENTPNDCRYHLSLLKEKNTIYDRFHIDELVYPKIYNRPPKITFVEANTIFRKVRTNGDLFIILYSSDINILKERLISRGEIDYLDEIEQQNILFIKYALVYKERNYKNFIAVDIADPLAYKNLDLWITEKMEVNNHE